MRLWKFVAEYFGACAILVTIVLWAGGNSGFTKTKTAVVAALGGLVVGAFLMITLISFLFEPIVKKVKRLRSAPRRDRIID